MPYVTLIEDSATSCVSPFSDHDPAISSNDQAIIMLADDLATPNFVLPDNYRPAFDTGFRNCAEHLHVFKDYLAYKEVRMRTEMTRHEIPSLLAAHCYNTLLDRMPCRSSRRSRVGVPSFGRQLLTS